MPVRGFDHIALTCADQEATLDFYRRVLGAEVLYEEAWRGGEIPVLMLQVGMNRMNIHPADAPAKPHAFTPTPGSADLCFRFDGPIAEAEALLRQEGVTVEVGPVARPAADGQFGQSVYFRDPDQNLLEFLSTDG